MQSLARRLRRAHVKQHEEETSQSRQTSFRLSRGDTASMLTAAGGGVTQTFPAFYSVRHKRLLPPKASLYDVEPHRLLAMFAVDQKQGLLSSEVEERRAMYGRNELPPPVQPSALQMLWGQLKDFIILVLCAASIVSLATQEWTSAGVLLVVVVINVAIGLIQERRSAEALKALSSFSVPQATVLRDGEVQTLPAAELLPGDIVQLDEGVSVPADLRLLDVSQLYTIESILTGESLPVLKSTQAIRHRGKGANKRGNFLPVGDRVNMAFMSTLGQQQHLRDFASCCSLELHF